MDSLMVGMKRVRGRMSKSIFCDRGCLSVRGIAFMMLRSEVSLSCELARVFEFRESAWKSFLVPCLLRIF